MIKDGKFLARFAGTIKKAYFRDVPYELHTLFPSVNENFTEPTWESGPRMATKRCYVEASCWHGKLYVVGGQNENGVHLDSVEVLDLQNGGTKWAPVVPLAMPRSFHRVVCSREGKLCAIGMKWGDALEQRSVEVFDLQLVRAGGAWTRAASMPFARNGVGVACWESKLYMVGGFDESETYLRGVEVLDLKDTSAGWKPVAVAEGGLNDPRCGHSLVCSGGKLYAIGGEDCDGEPMRSVEVLDLANKGKRWTRVAKLTTARSALGAVCWDGKLYALGGMGADLLSLASVEILDLATPNSGWAMQEQQMLEARHSFAAVVSDGVVYVIGGRNDSNKYLSPSVERLHLDARRDFISEEKSK